MVNQVMLLFPQATQMALATPSLAQATLLNRLPTLLRASQAIFPQLMVGQD